MSGLSPFARQYAIGIIVDIWGSKDGHYPMIAYQAAFTIILSLQVLAWSWYFSYELVTRLSLAAPLRQMACKIELGAPAPQEPGSPRNEQTSCSNLLAIQSLL
jgi:hypothetical protein